MRAILILLILIFPAFALSIQVNGNCVNDELYIYTDEPSFLILRMNYGYPIYANASPQQPAIFVPRITGDLLVTAISDSAEAIKVIKIKECVSTRHPSYEGRKTLPSGTFEEQGRKVNWRTALGALKKACEILGDTYSTKLTDWGIFVDCIRRICTGNLGKMSGWMYWVNYPEKPLPGVPASEYPIHPGDEVIWYFSRSMDEKPETSPYVLRIKIGPNYEIQIKLKWESKIPPKADFDFIPENPIVGEEVVFDASKSYDDRRIVQYIWEIEGKTFEGKVFRYRFENEGNYEIKLTVLDDEELSDSIKKTLFVRKPEMSNRFLIHGERLIDLGFGSLRIKAEKAEISIKKESCKIPFYYVKGCFSLKSNESFSAFLESEEELKVLDISNDRWIGVNRENEKYIARLFHGKFAVLTPWEDFPMKKDDERIRKALEYLRTLQKDDGGFGEKESLFSATSWAMMAIASAEENPEEWKRSGKSPIDYMREKIGEEVKRMGTTDLARTILALIYSNIDPRNFEGYDLVKMLKERVKDDGRIGDYVYTTIWGILALKAAGEDVSKSIEWLKSVQNPDGGFPWIAGEKSDCDDTSAAIQALMLAKEYEAVDRAIEYLKTCQNPDGGMKYFGESASNAASDSWAIQALVSAGENPMKFKKDLNCIVDHLISLQADEGYFKYTSHEVSNPGYMTVSAIMALLGKYHPMKTLPIYKMKLEGVENTTIKMPTQIFLETYIDEITMVMEKRGVLIEVEKLRNVEEYMRLKNASFYLRIDSVPEAAIYITFAFPKQREFIIAKFEDGKWMELKKDFVNQDDVYRYHTVFSRIPGYFAVSEKFEEEHKKEDKIAVETKTPEKTPEVQKIEKTKQIPGFELVLGIIVFLVLTRIRK